MGSRNPELQRLLDNLCSYSPQTRSGGDASSSTAFDYSHNVRSTSQTLSGQSIIPGLGLLPPEPEIPKQVLTPTNQQQSTPKPPIETRNATPTSSARDVPDPSIITTWPAALRHVTKYLAPNEAVQTRIRNLVTSQQKHERSWFEGRQALIAMQASRTKTSAQVAAMLQSMGGASVEAKADARVNEQELENYDRKVYAGLEAMTADFDRQLRSLGLPFYAIKHDLVILEEGTQKEGHLPGRIDRGELRELQKKMLGLLEDLFME
jgi:hypothetical protein